MTHRRRSGARIRTLHPAFAWWLIASAAIGTVAGLAIVFAIDLPQINDLGHYRPITNTVLYDDAGRPFASFALQRRTVAQFEDFPKVLYDAVLSIEDKNFENHPGFELWRMVGAARRDLQLDRSAQGASTLTMQLARNLFLSRERTYSRKLREIMLAIQIERHFTKSQIFTLYANQIYLGQGVYGFETGAHYYFGKAAKDLTLEEAALLAALPKGPNIYSPIKDPKRALQRRNFVIDSMLAAGKISLPEASVAKRTPIQLRVQDDTNSLAPHFVEGIRQYLEKQYGTEQVHEGGLKVYTSLNIDLQEAANKALLNGLTAYEKRHGSRAGLEDQKKATENNRRQFEQKSSVEGALLAIDSSSGEIKAMVGGRDYERSKFNRATQALRQVGSSFKPYVYTAAIDQGAAPDDIVIDSPETFLTASGPYTPHNYDGKFEGAITLAHALAESRNLPALRLARTLSIKTVIGYARRFGINEPIPNYLPVALGAADLTLLDQTSAFTAFPNDGLRAIPHSIVKVTDYDGSVLEQHYTIVQDVISRDTARTMTWMLREVVLHGTARAAMRLKRPLAGKTGTTNDFTDAWFIGFSPSLTCGVWVGFDEKITLGNKETGARAALPIWIDFMATALLREKSGHDFLRPTPLTNRTLATQTSSAPSEEQHSGHLAIREQSSLFAQPASKTSREYSVPDIQERQ